MLKKDELLAEIERLLCLKVAKKDWIRGFAEVVNKKRNVPVEIVISIVTQRTSLRDYDDFIIFCIAERTKLKHELNYYFTQSELAEYQNHVYEEITVKFPYKFTNMVEISEKSQYIGKITVKELMAFRDAQLINYNENAQRTLKAARSKDGTEYLTISLNRKAVNEIMQMLDAKAFVPNTLTFNISPDTDFSYNKETLTLTIKEKIQFDILDGYHRYIALSNMFNIHKDFDYPMELRIVVFSESKARQFIYQEDQKTKMRKIDSDALSSTDPANEICAKIKNKLAGNINVARNDGMIDESVLSEMIRVLCIKSDRRYDNQTKNYLRDLFVDAVLKAQDDYNIDLKTKWSISFTVAFALLVYTNRMSESKLKEVDTAIRELKMITGKTINRTIINRIRKEVLV